MLAKITSWCRFMASTSSFLNLLTKTKMDVDFLDNDIHRCDEQGGLPIQRRDDQIQLDVAYCRLWPWICSLNNHGDHGIRDPKVQSMRLETYDKGRFLGGKCSWVFFKLMLAVACTCVLAIGPELYASQFDVRKYVSGILGGLFTHLFIESLKTILWAVLNKNLDSASGVSVLDLKTVMSLVGGFEGTQICSAFVSISYLIYFVQLVGPVLMTLFFSMGFSTVERRSDPSVSTLELTEIGGCFQGKCLATSATLLGLLNFPITHGMHLDGASLPGSGEVNVFYPVIPEKAVESYWSNSSARTPVFTIEQLPGLFVEARTAELSSYPKMEHVIETTISEAGLNLSYTSRAVSGGAFSMDLAGQVVGSSGTATFLFSCNVSCATADTTIISSNGNLEIQASEQRPTPECDWDNSSLEMWRAFESSIGIGIRYDYNSWFDSLRNDSTPSRQISELLGSVIAHRLSTGEASIKRFPGTFTGTTQYVEFHERVAPWTAFVAGVALVVFFVRFVLMVWVPCYLLRADLFSFADFLAGANNAQLVRAQVTSAVVNRRLQGRVVAKAPEAPGAPGLAANADTAFTQM